WERRADELALRVSCDLHHLLVHVRDNELRIDGDEGVDRGLDQAAVVVLGLSDLALQLLLFRDVAGRGEHAFQLPVSSLEGRRIVRHDGLPPGNRLQGEFVVRDSVLGEHSPDSILGALDRKSTRLNSSHVAISYAVFCLKKKKTSLAQ